MPKPDSHHEDMGLTCLIFLILKSSKKKGGAVAQRIQSCGEDSAQGHQHGQHSLTPQTGDIP